MKNGCGVCHYQAENRQYFTDSEAAGMGKQKEAKISKMTIAQEQR